MKVFCIGLVIITVLLDSSLAMPRKPNARKQYANYLKEEKDLVQKSGALVHWKYKSFVLVVLYTTLNWVTYNYNNDAVFQILHNIQSTATSRPPIVNNGALRVTTPDPDVCCRGLGGSSFSDLSGPGARYD